MKCEIIAVGDEVVKGYTVNTNATFVAQSAESLGMHIERHTAVRDDKEAISQTVKEALKRSDVLFMIGGLGPTEDDLTK